MNFKKFLIFIFALSTFCSCGIETSENSSYESRNVVVDSHVDNFGGIEIIDVETTTETTTMTTEVTTTTSDTTTTTTTSETKENPTPKQTSYTKQTTQQTTKTATKRTTHTTSNTVRSSETTTVTTSKSSDIGITQAEFYMLANLVAHEYGADWVPTAEKAKVVMTVMNRVRSSRFPNTIREVILQRNQYCWVPDSYYWNRVTKDCKNAVTYYFNHQSEFSTNLYSFWGDGRKNHFY